MAQLNNNREQVKTTNTGKIPHFKQKCVLVVSLIVIFLIICANSDTLFGNNTTTGTKVNIELNEARQKQIERLNNAVASYQINNNGRMPTDADAFIKKYLGNYFVDPNGTPLTIKFETLSQEETKTLENAEYIMHVFGNATCVSGEQVKYSTSKSDFATMYYAPDNGTVMCIH